MDVIAEGLGNLRAFDAWRRAAPQYSAPLVL
jgi:hypothetical protein